MKKSLRFLVFLLVIFTILGILGSTLFAGYLVTKENSITHTEEINRVYSEKLAQVTDQVFIQMTKSLEARAGDMVFLLDEEDALTTSLELFLRSSNNFNSIAVINDDAKIIASSPPLGIDGYHIRSKGINEAIEKRETMISDPYHAAIGEEIVLISTPLWDEEENYLGMLAGTIYLQENNIIDTILGEHFSKDGSYVYVVDDNGSLIYHPDKSRIGEVVTDNAAVQKLINGESGTIHVTNTQEIDMIAGFTYIPSSQWGVVSQTPYSVSIQPVSETLGKMIVYTLPFVVVILLLAFLFAERIASPLRKLAFQTLTTKERTDPKSPKISNWYFEAAQLNQTIEQYIQLKNEQLDFLKKESLTDTLTGLANRRAAWKTLDHWKMTKSGFSLLLIDLDFFKNINDTYGHHIGDEVLIYFAKQMQQVTRTYDVCIRYGGEEFMILIPNPESSEAVKVADRLRETLFDANSPTGQKITFSAGIASYTSHAEDLNDLIHRADQALYKAKNEGRNRTNVAT
ncbi:sensor domain-containing diguanylate cyclase [Bacillus sp. FJAT-45037]|uniref:sensor domain-containing diguanylate cyclase n=1 Tax=Bacillus sp. FJAT-45037 TaxID=2011007 RepID=UPI000C23EF17|nr:sensor domain-containing diguanylate cyclase [Bacillus sp. FJAT-45037]